MNILSIIIIAIVVISAVVFLFMAIKRFGPREVAIKFIVEAEKMFQNEKGSVKFNYVVDRVYENIPGILKIFITKVNIIQFIQKVFDEIKIALDYQKPQV